MRKPDAKLPKRLFPNISYFGELMDKKDRLGYTLGG
jgi:hypothetical protein